VVARATYTAEFGVVVVIAAERLLVNMGASPVEQGVGARRPERSAATFGSPGN